MARKLMIYCEVCGSDRVSGADFVVFHRLTFCSAECREDLRRTTTRAGGRRLLRPIPSAPRRAPRNAPPDPVALRPGEAYLKGGTSPLGAKPPDRHARRRRSTPRSGSWPLVIAGALGVLLVGATLALWAHYGTAVFFEVIAAGLAACF